MVHDTFVAWEIYQGIKLHFTTKYDYIKYHGKIKNPWARFQKEKSKKSFTYLAQKYEGDYKHFIATAFATNPNIKWVGDCSDDECVEAFNKSNKYLQSLTKSFSDDIDGLMVIMKTNNIPFSGLFESINNDLPIIEKTRLQNLTSIETSVILQQLIGWIEKIDTGINPVWDDSKKMLLNYTPFINVDLKTCTNILKNKLK